VESCDTGVRAKRKKREGAGFPRRWTRGENDGLRGEDGQGRVGREGEETKRGAVGWQGLRKVGGGQVWCVLLCVI